MYLIAGLGNPGKKYEDTRHNVGFRAIKKLADKYGVTNMKEQKKGLTATMTVDGEKVMLVEPLTFMNLSGQCIGELARYYHIEPENIIVIYDDVDLPVGAIRVRAGGKPGTHNGMKSIVSHLGTKDFNRVRIGVGSRKPDEDLADFVLSRFPKAEDEKIEESAAMAAEAALDIVRLGSRACMNKYNGLFKKQKKAQKKAKEDGKPEGEAKSADPTAATDVKKEEN